MISRTLRSGLLIALLITLATTATAVIGGPDPGEGGMAITSHSASTSVSGSAGASQSSRMDDHITNISLEFQFGAEDAAMPASCQADIREALSKAERQICTEQVANLQCPQDEESVYMAPNGCVISSLQGQGWEQVPLNASDDGQAPNVTLSGDISFRTGGYQVQTDSWTEDGTAMFVINVSAPGPNETVTQAIETDEIEMTEDSGTYDSAEATVYIDGEQMYSRSETRQSEQVVEGPSRPPVEPPAQGLQQRVRYLEQRVATLEARLRLMENALQQEGIIEEDGLTLPEDGPGNSSESGDERDETSQEPTPPGRGLFDAIRGIFG
jgi:hypothetical protein